jgi:hypothetical protein
VTDEQWEINRREVIELIKSIFDERVRGQTPAVDTVTHHGSEGHWLQRQFGLEPDARNAPDFNGFELKDDTGGKTTFGDWAADQYIFFSHAKCSTSQEIAVSCDKCRDSEMSRDMFFDVFGAPNPMKNNRPSWSGKVFPKVGLVNERGQELVVAIDGSIEARYHFSQDLGDDKYSRVPSSLQRDDVVTARWGRERLKSRLENKFGGFGWFKCIQEDHGHGRYIGVIFGRPIMYDQWIQLVRDSTVYLDSGMYKGNDRLYQQWRADNRVWARLSDESY